QKHGVGSPRVQVRPLCESRSIFTLFPPTPFSHSVGEGRLSVPSLPNRGGSSLPDSIRREESLLFAANREPAINEEERMKIYIMTDLEGPAGVNRWIQTREGETPEKAAAMLLLTGEVNAAIEGIRDAAPEAEIVVLDGHGTGGLAFAQLHPAARSIMHGRGLRAPYGLDTSFDAVFFVGQHAMAGTPDAPLCHTYSSRHIEYYKLNGSFI